ncbi:MAG: GNAT family N-acetyltransferase [Gaiellaceae bacterium]
MNDLERIEAEGYAVFCELAGGEVTQLVGGLCLKTPIAAVELNRVTNVSDELDLDEVERVFGGSPHLVSVPPWVERLPERLTARGYACGYAWMKFERGPEPAPRVESELRVQDATDLGLFMATIGEGFGAPPDAARDPALVDRPGWHAFLAWDGDQPAAAAGLFVGGDVAWLGGAATRPAFRRRGAQTALLAARIERALAVGARRVCTETGERVPGRADQSYRNILRAGFREAYLRPNWRSPAH